MHKKALEDLEKTTEEELSSLKAKTDQAASRILASIAQMRDLLLEKRVERRLRQMAFKGPEQRARRHLYL